MCQAKRLNVFNIPLGGTARERRHTSRVPSRLRVGLLLARPLATPPPLRSLGFADPPLRGYPGRLRHRATKQPDASPRSRQRREGDGANACGAPMRNVSRVPLLRRERRWVPGAECPPPTCGGHPRSAPPSAHRADAKRSERNHRRLSASSCQRAPQGSGATASDRGAQRIPRRGPTTRPGERTRQATS